MVLLTSLDWSIHSCPNLRQLVSIQHLVQMRISHPVQEILWRWCHFTWILWILFFVSIYGNTPSRNHTLRHRDAYIRRGDPQTRSPPTRYRGHWLDIARDAFLNLWTLDDESHRLSPSFNFPIPPALLRHFKSILSANSIYLSASKKICNFALSDVWMRNDI